jgi:hypothetical protein
MRHINILITMYNERMTFRWNGFNDRREKKIDYLHAIIINAHEEKKPLSKSNLCPPTSEMYKKIIHLNFQHSELFMILD